MKSELKRAEDGLEALAQDIHKWWKERKTKRVEKTKDVLAIVVMVAIIIAFIYGIIWVLTHFIRW
jgi:diacylglycerol kinase